jgi:hypothetical protein
MEGSIIVLVTALLVGLAFGFVLQRGRFCVNTAFRDVIFIQDYTVFRAYLLAVLVAILGANLLEDLGLIEGGLRRQGWAIVANAVGGYLFGLGIVLAGGCGSGILYRVGEGSLAAWFAVLGFAIGIMATMHGVLEPVDTFLKSFLVEVRGVRDPALWDIFGGGMAAKWLTITVVTVILGYVVLKGKPFAKGPAKGYSWSLTGLLIGIIAVAAWWASAFWGGGARGLSFAGPTSDFFMTVLTGDSEAPRRLTFNFWGWFNSTWSAFYVIALPIGAYLSARGLKEFKWKAPGAEELLIVFFGSFMMGFGAAVAGG